MAITVVQYRFDAGGVCQTEKTERVRSNRDAEARIRRWCREAGHDPVDLDSADTEFGFQFSLSFEDCGTPNTLLWETTADSLIGE